MSDNKKSIIGKITSKFPGIAKSLLGLSGVPLLQKASDLIKTQSDIKEEERQELLSQIEIEIQDLQNAREYNFKVQDSQFASKLAKYTPYIIDLFISLVWGVMTLFIVVKAINPSIAKEADFSTILAVYAAVTGLMTTVLSFLISLSKYIISSHFCSKSCCNLHLLNIYISQLSIKA